MEMNMSRLEAATMTDEDLSNAVNALPFMAEKRLVLLANPSRRYVGPRARAKAPTQVEVPASDQAPSEAEHQLEREARPDDQAPGAIRTEAREKFLEFLGRVPSTTRLVITELVELRSKRGSEAAETHWLVKWIRKAGLGLERHALPAPGADMESWIIRNAKAQGSVIGQAAANRLAQMVGTDTRQAAQEITKLLTYVNWTRPVTAADVDALSPLTAEPNVFALVDALVNGKGGEAHSLLHRFLENGDLWRTWGMIIRQFRLLLLAREVIDRGGDKTDAAQALAVHPYVAEKAVEQARRFTLPALEQIYHQLLEVDEAAKTGRMPLELGLDLLVVELAG
jgi:DNA polymerase-3 subunit delta